MKVTKTISIDLARRDTIRSVLAVEGDSGTRSVEILLKNQFEPWAVPEGVTASLAYKKSDGTAGWYDTLPDGSEACTIDGSTVLVELAPQVLSTVGQVLAAVVLRDEAGHQLTTFEFLIDVKSSPAGCGASEDYYNLKVVASIAELQAQIDELKENGAGNSTLVQSVNGIAPDENGNVEIDFDDPVETDPTVFDWAKRELFNKADLPTSIQSFVTVDGIEYYRYHAGATYGFTWYNPSPLPGAVTITARGVAQYGGTNGTRLKTIYSDGTYGPDLYIVASGESRTVTVTTDTSKTLAKITGNYDMENWVLLDMSVMSVQAEYNRGLPLADSNAAGGVLADSAEETDTQPVRIGPDGKLYTAPGGGVVAQAEEPEDTDVLWIDTDDDDEPEETDTGTDKSLGITGAEVGQTVRITAVDENGVPTAWEAVETEEKWELLTDITLEEEANGISTDHWAVPQKKIRMILDTLAADANTNFSPVTVKTSDNDWSRLFKFYPYAMPVTYAARSIYEVEILSDADVKVTTRYGNMPSVNKIEAISNGACSEMIWTPVDSYGLNINPQITAVGVGTYATFAAGTRLRVWGVAK